VISAPSLPARTSFACTGEASPSVLTSSPAARSLRLNSIMKAMFASRTSFGQLTYRA